MVGLDGSKSHNSSQLAVKEMKDVELSPQTKEILLHFKAFPRVLSQTKIFIYRKSKLANRTSSFFDTLTTCCSLGLRESIKSWTNYKHSKQLKLLSTHAPKLSHVLYSGVGEIEIRSGLGHKLRHQIILTTWLRSEENISHSVFTAHPE